MNARLVTAALTLTLILASCGTQQSASQNNTIPTTAATDRSRDLAPLKGTENPDTIPGQYIVVFSAGATSGGLSAQGMEEQSLTSLSAPQLIKALNLDPQGVSVQSIYSQALHGFSAKLSEQNLQTLRADKRIKYVEQDQWMYASATQTSPTWGLDRIDQRSLPLDRSYTYANTGSSVTAFIIDTGVNINHTLFGGRATWGANFTGDGQNIDCGGHGTHVAGTVGSSTYGVAKGVRIKAVKVLGCDGKGANSWVIAGMDYAIKTVVSGRKVVNMSLGPQTRSTSDAMDSAVASVYNNNIPVAVAAGNSGDDACYYSPARASVAITVGNTTSSDARASSSNYGACLDTFAPGTSITSTWIGGTTATNTITGTSMASPHVAGAAALILTANPSYSAAQVTSAIVNSATTGKVTGVTGSPNRLLYTGSLSGGDTTTPPPPVGTTTTYSGYASSGTSSYQPGSSGFTYAGGTLKATLASTSITATDHDLYLQKWNGSSWVDVAVSENANSDESITYSATSGTYRWEVYAYAGSGGYTLTVTKQ